MNDLISLPKCILAVNGAQFDFDLTFEEWAELGKQAIRASECIQWLIGDWINFGQARYVDPDGKDAPIRRQRFKLAIEALPYQYQTLANFRWVAKSIDFSRRREKLSFRHHAEVAGLDPKKQDHYLSLAEKHDLSVADIREAIRKGEAEVSDDGGPGPEESPNHWTNRLSLWCAQQDPAKWPRARREIVKQEIRPIVEFYNRL